MARTLEEVRDSMLTVEKDDGLFVLKASDRITIADIEAFEPPFDELADERGKVPLAIVPRTC